MARTLSWNPLPCLLAGALVVFGCRTDIPPVEPEDPEVLGGASSDGGSRGVGGLGGASMDSEPGEPELPLPDPGCPAATQGFATEVIDHEFGEGQDFGQDAFPEAVLGGPQGAGCCGGSLDVTSLGDGGYVVLGFGQRTIVDGQGPDFIVFENPFWVGGDPEVPLAELGHVDVSVDGDQWFSFSCAGEDGPPYPGCSGWQPVLANVTDSAAPSAFDVEEAGGEAFDLADVGLEEARYVRIFDRAGDDVVYDLDAVAIVNGRCD